MNNADDPVTNGVNDLDLRKWREYADVLTDSLWVMPSRERKRGHKLEYHGNFIPQVATQLLRRFSREHDIVLDLFLGSGTTAIEAMNQNRRCIGVDLNETLIAGVQEKIQASAERLHLIAGDSADPQIVPKVRAVLAAWQASMAQLVILHPPYHDIIRFSDSPHDLSQAPTTEAFLEQFGAVARHAWELLAPGRVAAVVIGDKYAHARLIPLGFLCMQQMEAVGFVPKSIVVKNIEGNEIAKGRRSNLWRYRALRHGLYLFKHEYVCIFQKPR